MPDSDFSLTLEQQFVLNTLYRDIDRMDVTQLRSTLKEVLRQQAHKDNLVKHWMRTGHMPS